MTITIGIIGERTTQKGHIHDTNGRFFIVDDITHPENKFKSQKHQTEMLEIFTSAMTAFPSSFSMAFFLTAYTNKKVKIGTVVQFTDELQDQIDDGSLISK